MPALVFTDDAGAERQFRLGEARTSIGRHEGNDITLNDPLVSRKHCAIERRDEGWWLVDLKSRFGSYANSERVDGERLLGFGDQLRIGNTPMRFERDAGDLPDAKPAVSPRARRVATQAHPAERQLQEAGILAQQLSSFIADPNSVTGVPRHAAAALIEQIESSRKAVAELEERRRLAQTLAEVGKLINLVTDLDTTLRLTLDLAVEAMCADGGVLYHRAQGDPIPRATKSMTGLHADSEVVRTVLETGRVDSGESHVCAPMLNKAQKAIGAVYLCGTPGAEPFRLFRSEAGLEFLTGFASQVAIAIENAELSAQTALDEHRRQTLSRYFSEGVVEDIMSGRESEKLGGASRRITLLFTDIRGFTNLLEKLTPAEAVEMLNDYFTEIVDDILLEQGTLDKFTGDGIMAFWGAPKTQEDHALRAVRAAFHMQARMPDLLARWKTENRSFLRKATDLAAGIGVHTGEAVVGNIGSPKRMEYTAIGDAVNLTARIQGLARGGEVLISLETMEQVSGRVTADPLPPVQVKGKSNLVPIFRVTAVS